MAGNSSTHDGRTGEGGDSYADMKAHAQTYDRVIGLLKWGAVGCGCIALAVILIISR